MDRGLKAGDRTAGPLWNRYFERLVRLAKGKMSARVRSSADEEDIALSAFLSFRLTVDEGRFPRLDDRDDLWAVLVTLTERKVYAHRLNRPVALKMVLGDARLELSRGFEAGELSS